MLRTKTQTLPDLLHVSSDVKTVNPRSTRRRRQKPCTTTPLTYTTAHGYTRYLFLSSVIFTSHIQTRLHRSSGERSREKMSNTTRERPLRHYFVNYCNLSRIISIHSNTVCHRRELGICRPDGADTIRYDTDSLTGAKNLICVAPMAEDICGTHTNRSISSEDCLHCLCECSVPYEASNLAHLSA